MDKSYDDGPMRHSQLRRLAIFLAGTLIVISLTSYAALAFELTRHRTASTGALFNVINSFHTFTDTRPWTDEHEHDVAGEDRFTLHPEQHVFRQPHKIRLEWNVTKESRAPDGVSKDIYLINGLFPGPTIEARPGDELEVQVTNNVQDQDKDGIAIHWHGMYMKGANEMDGAVGVTQCTIPNNKSFLYKFKIDDNQHGTFWYHAHSAVKRADGLYGGLVVHKPAGQDKTTDMQTHTYESEKLLMVSDWHHWNSTFTQGWYADPDHFGREPPPESIIINGQGSFNCSRSTHYVPTECIDTKMPAVNLPGGKSVRLRVINTGTDAGYSLQLKQGGSFRLITVDGGSVVDRAPLSAAVGVLYPGERMDVILEDTKDSKREDAELTVVLDGELMQIVNPALDPVQSFPISWPISESESSRDKRGDATIAKQFDLHDAQGESLQASSPVHTKPDNLAVLYASLSIRSINNNHPTGDVNHTAWVLADPNAKPMLALDREDWGNVTKQPSPIQLFKVPYFEDGGWMDLVINNMDDRGHPFHMHGYDFYVVESTANTLGQIYNPFDPKNTAYAQQKLNTKTPLRKDTVRLPPQGHVVLRFKLDNPGLWLMHCHVLWHQAVGMGIVVQVGNVTETTMGKAGEHCT